MLRLGLLAEPGLCRKHGLADVVAAVGGRDEAGLEGRRSEVDAGGKGDGANDGGMRIGEMERDGIIAHGMSTFMKESFGERSDGTRFVVDDHGFSFANEKRMLVGRKSASKLGDHARLHGIECPAALKLLSHELKAFHIDLKLEVPPPKPPARGPRPLDPPPV